MLDPEDSDAYHGIVMWMEGRGQPRIIFTCEHAHPFEGEALTCAETRRLELEKEHASKEREAVPASDLTPGYDRILTTPVYYKGRLAVVTEGEPPDIRWECPHRHGSDTAALQCANWEREQLARAGDLVPVTVPAGELTEVFEEIRQWAALHGSAEVAGYQVAAVCAEVVRRWPDRNWGAYAAEAAGLTMTELTFEPIAQQDPQGLFAPPSAAPGPVPAAEADGTGEPAEAVGETREPVSEAEAGAAAAEEGSLAALSRAMLDDGSQDGDQDEEELDGATAR